MVILEMNSRQTHLGFTGIGKDSTSYSIVLPGPPEGIGVKPAEMLLIAPASCAAPDVVEILQKSGIPDYSQ